MTWIHGNLLPYQGRWPTVNEEVFIALTATVMGRVTIDRRSNIWYNTVIRGDENTIDIGEETNIQDGTVVHIDHRTYPTVIGSRVTIGHGAIIHACHLQDDCFVGMGATVLDGSVVETDGMLAAGALLSPGKVVPAGELWGGVPARKMRNLTEAEIRDFRRSAQHYCTLADEHHRSMTTGQSLSRR